jgi:hypothetical protein
MDKHVFSTPFGEAWLWGAAPAPEKPLVLVIEGAFSIPRPRGFDLAGYLPEASVLNAHLPGNHCPPAVAQSVGAYAALYSDVLRQIGRPAVVAGASVGALVGLAMRDANVKGVVASDPPLVTGNLWPLAPGFRQRLADPSQEPWVSDFIWNVFGVSADRHENRDYRPLLDQLGVPAWALLGTEPLQPPRKCAALPSLVDEPERALLRGHPRVRVREVPGVGHNVPGRGIQFVRTAARDLLNTPSAAQAAPANLEEM